MIVPPSSAPPVESAEGERAAAGETQSAAGESRHAERRVRRGESPQPAGGAQRRHEEERAASQPTSAEKNPPAGIRIRPPAPSGGVLGGWGWGGFVVVLISHPMGRRCRGGS